MRGHRRLSLWAGSLLFFVPVAVSADTPPAMAAPAGLSFVELKVTGDEFLVLQNNSGSDIANLSSYWLEAFNNVNPLASGASNSSQQLPQTALANGQTLLLSSVTGPTCGAAVAGKLSVSLTDGGGFLELVQMSQNAGGAVTQMPVDVVSWSSGTNGIMQNVPSNSKDPQAAYYRYQNATSYLWQQADVDGTNPCQLNVITEASAPAQPVSIAGLAQPGTSPPATIISLASETVAATASGPVMPAADFGLLAPQLSELLPNPVGTGTDGTDEFVELYNPNGAAFDLSGFALRVGTTTTHTFTFPAGTSLPGKTFTAFYSSDTGLSMSNTGGQAVLLDPFGTVVSQTDTYTAAKDGQAWAIANGTWYWTTAATPGAANVINQPAGASSKSSSPKAKSSKTGSTSGVKGASTSSTLSTGAPDNAQATAQPIHPLTLAVVALAAILYGAYEYRVDLANRIYKFRTNRAARRAAGQ